MSHIPGRPLASPILLIAAVGVGACRVSGTLHGSVTLEPGEGAAYSDSFLRAVAVPEPAFVADTLACTWWVDDTAEAATEGLLAPSGQVWYCALDAISVDPGAGSVVWAELVFSRNGEEIGRMTSPTRTFRLPPKLWVTELDNGTLALVDSANNELLQRTELFDEETVDTVTGASVVYGYPMMAGYTPTRERLLVTSSRYGILWEVDPATGEVAARHDLSEEIYGFAWSDDGRTLYVADDDNDGVALVDVDTWETGAIIPTGRMPITVERASDGLLYVPNQLANTVSVIDPAQGVVGEVTTAANPYHAIPEPGLERLWVAEEVPGAVEVWSLPELEPLASFTAGTHSVAITFSPDGDLFFVGDFLDSCVYYGDPDDYEPSGAIPSGSGSVGLTWRDDQRMLFVANIQEGTVSVLDRVNLRKVHDIKDLLGPRLVVQLQEAARPDSCWPFEVKQPETNLCWRRCPKGQVYTLSLDGSWRCDGSADTPPQGKATQHCEGLGDGVRPATHAEILGLLGGCDEDAEAGGEGRCDPCSSACEPAADPTCAEMFGRDTHRYWTDLLSEDGTEAVVVNFCSGATEIMDANDQSRVSVRCVRDIGVEP